jgi:hypothetical protein
LPGKGEIAMTHVRTTKVSYEAQAEECCESGCGGSADVNFEDSWDPVLGKTNYQHGREYHRTTKKVAMQAVVQIFRVPCFNR